MPDLDFPDLVNPAADAVTPPPFDALRARAERRQRRRAASTALAVVVAIAAVASGIALGTGQHHSSIPPAAPTSSPSASGHHLMWPTMSSDERLAWVLGGAAYQYAVDDVGDFLYIWSRAEKLHGVSYPEHSAWQLQTASEQFSGLIHNDARQPTPVEGGFVVNRWQHGPLFIALDGTATPFTRVAAPDVAGTLHNDDIEIDSRRGPALADPETKTWWVVPHAGGYQPGVAPGDGTYWMWESQAAEKGVVLVQRPHDGQPSGTQVVSTDATAHGQIVSSSGPVGSHPRMLAAFASSDGATVAPVRAWAVSYDGVAFDVFPASTVPFTDVDSMAVSDSGTLFVGNAEGQLWRSTDDTWLHFAMVRGLRGHALRSGGAGVILEEAGSESEDGEPPGLLTLDNTGSAGPWKLSFSQ